MIWIKDFELTQFKVHSIKLPNDNFQQNSKDCTTIYLYLTLLKQEMLIFSDHQTNEEATTKYSPIKEQFLFYQYLLLSLNNDISLEQRR